MYEPLTTYTSERDRQHSQAAYQPGGYHDRQGFNTTDVNAAHYGSKRKPSKMYLPNSTWQWSFSLVTLAQAVIAIALEAYVFGEFEAKLNRNAINRGDPGYDKRPDRTIPTYLSVFIFGFVYQLVLVWDALRLKNTIQVIGLCLYNLGMLIYGAVQVDQIKEAVDNLARLNWIKAETWSLLKPFLVAVPCIIALGTVIMSWVAWKLYQEFAWTIYKHISADVRMKRRYLIYQIYIALLKFDFFFFLGFTVQFLVIVGASQGTYIGPAEFYLTIVAIPVTIVLLVLAGYFTRRESYWGQSAIIVVYFAAMAYFIFKLERMYAGRTEDFYEAARRSLTIFAVLTILLLVVTIAVAGLCMRNFNKGLRPHLQRRKVPEVDEQLYAGKYAGDGTHPLAQVPSRMTID